MSTSRSISRRAVVTSDLDGRIRSVGRALLDPARCRRSLRSSERHRLRGGDSGHRAAQPDATCTTRCSNVAVPSGRYMVEMTPVPDREGERRGVVAEGPVGLRAAGCLRLFRYEVRRWRDGVVPDLGFAVESPVTVATDSGFAEALFDLLPSVPTLTWGRDEARTGDMWSCNSVTSWALTRAGSTPTPSRCRLALEPPAGMQGRSSPDASSAPPQLTLNATDRTIDWRSEVAELPGFPA